MKEAIKCSIVMINKRPNYNDKSNFDFEYQNDLQLHLFFISYYDTPEGTTNQYPLFQGGSSRIDLKSIKAIDVFIRFRVYLLLAMKM